LEVCTQTYKLPKLQKSQFREFQDSNMGVSGQNDIWVLAPWPGTMNTIRGKVVASPKFGPWWVLWVHVCPWLICAPKMFQLRTNQLVVWFVQVHVSNWIACHFSYSPSRSFNTPLYPKSVASQGTCPTPYLVAIFTLDSHLSLSYNVTYCWVKKNFFNVFFVIYKWNISNAQTKKYFRINNHLNPHPWITSSKLIYECT